MIGDDWEEVGVKATQGGLATWEMDALNRRSKVVLTLTLTLTPNSNPQSSFKGGPGGGRTTT